MSPKTTAAEEPETRKTSQLTSSLSRDRSPELNYYTETRNEILMKVNETSHLL